MMMGRNNTKKPVWVALAAIVVLGGMTTYAVMSPRQIPPELSKDKPKPVKQLTPKYDKGSLTFDEAHAVAPAGTDPMVQVVNDYLDKVPAVPKEAQLLDVKMEGATAVLNFNDAFRAGYGTEDEQIIIQGILSSLAQFSEVRNVLFKINGQSLDSIGNIDLSEPQPVTREDSKGSEAPPPDSPEKGG